MYIDDDDNCTESCNKEEGYYITEINEQNYCLCNLRFLFFSS